MGAVPHIPVGMLLGHQWMLRSVMIRSLLEFDSEQ